MLNGLLFADICTFHLLGKKKKRRKGLDFTKDIRTTWEVTERIFSCVFLLITWPFPELHLAGDASASPWELPEPWDSPDFPPSTCRVPWAAPQPWHSRSDQSPAESCAPAPARAAKVSALIRDSGRLFPNLSSSSCWCDAAFEIINPLGAGLCCRMHQRVPRLQQQSPNYLGFSCYLQNSASCYPG